MSRARCLLLVVSSAFAFAASAARAVQAVRAGPTVPGSRRKLLEDDRRRRSELPASGLGVRRVSADNATCTYASGAVVTFTPPLVFPISTDTNWNFTISNGGQDCLHYEDTGVGVKLAVGGNMVTESASGALGLAIACPDNLGRDLERL